VVGAVFSVPEVSGSILAQDVFFILPIFIKFTIEEEHRTVGIQNAIC
jgi:hypothetical protein